MVVDAQGNEVGKLFVGGLHQSTTNDSLKAYFSKFGDIEESIVMMDNRTGRSRGFGYIKFKENSSVDSVLAQKPHSIDHKEVDPKRCNVNMKGKNRRSLKVFVGGISLDQDENSIRNFFSKYGRVTEVNLLATPNKQRHRGFAFVGFEDELVVQLLIRQHFLNMDGKKVEIKAMEPPLGQRVGYPSPSYSMQQSHLMNGRAVRGGRGSHMHSLPSNEYIPWNQWNPIGAAAWTSFMDNSASWAQNPVNWLNRTNGGDMVRHSQLPSGRLLELSHPHNPGWPDSSTVSTNGWIPPGWSNQNMASSSTGTQVPVLREDLSLYTNPIQPHPKPHTPWDSLCYTHPPPTAPMHHGNYFTPLESWTNTNANANNNTGDTVYHHQTDWNHPQKPADQLQSGASHRWTDPSSDANGTGFLTDGTTRPNDAMAAMLGATGSSNAMAQWAAAVASDLGTLKLDDCSYRSPTAYVYQSHNTLPQLNSGDSIPAGLQTFNGPLPSDWPHTAVANTPLPGPQSLPKR